MKKILSLLLLALLSVTQAMAYSFEVGGIYYTKSGTTAIVTYGYGDNDYSGDVVIPETVTYGDVTYNVTAIGADAFKGRSGLTSIMIPESVTSIGSDAFSGCSGLTSITIPESVTTIGSYAFGGCSGLTSITISEGVKFIGSRAFSGCSRLTSITIPEGVTSIGNAFSGCSGLTSITISEGVTSIDSDAFSGCYGLTSITIPESVTSIGRGAFSGCSSLESMTLPFVGTSAQATGADAVFGIIFSRSSFAGGTYIKQYYSETSTVDFYIPTSLKEVTITGGSLPYGAFSGCSGLTSITIPNISSIGSYAFYGCKSLQGNFYIPSTVTSIGSYAYANTGRIIFYISPDATTPANLGNNVFTTNSIIYVTNSQYDAYVSEWTACSSQIVIQELGNQNITVEANDNASAIHMAIGESNLKHVTNLKVSGTINGYDIMIMHDKMPNLVQLDLSDVDIVQNDYVYRKTGSYTSKSNILTPYFVPTSVEKIILPLRLTAIDQYAFSDCNLLSEINLPQNIVSIGDYAFKNCSALSTMVIPDNVRDIGDNIFEGCQIENLTVPFLGRTIKEAGNIQRLGFGRGFNYLTTAHIKGGVLNSSTFEGAKLRKVTLGADIKKLPSSCFSSMSNLTDITIEGDITSIGGNAFYSCTSLKSLPSFDSVIDIGERAFMNCKSLENVELPLSLETLGAHAFNGCTNLKSCRLPENSKLKILRYSTFQDCTSLERFDIPVSITEIEFSAFSGCTALTEVRIPTGMTTIGSGAFGGCTNLFDVYTYTVEPQEIQQTTFTTSSYQNGTLHCPKVSYYNYYYATPWNQFLNLTAFDEPYQYVYIEKDFNIFSDVISGEPEFRIGTGGGLIMNGVVKQVADMLHIKFDPSIGKGSSIISNGMIDAYTLKVDIDVKKDFWHFFCFPFDVDLTTGVEKDGSWIFREFDGMSRAENGAGNSWKDITGTKLEAGKGYIFRTNTAGTLTLTVAGLAGGKIDLRCSNIVKQLQNCFKGGSSAATEPANKNWNFIGNGYLSYYDINDLDYSAPIMTWDGSKYVAYRPGDDDCVLTPFQGFFVQKPESNDAGVGFKADARTTYLKSQDPAARSASRRKAAARLDSCRKLVNLTVCSATDEEATADKARVVFNEKQTMDYELECDASKFISTENVPLIYSLDARGTRYAINERPMADGRVSLGFIAREDGQYTIAATRMDVPVVLIDNATGTTHDLNDGDYIFTADKGTYEQRFVLAVAEDYLTDGITTICTDEQGAAANIYDLQGKRVERQQQGVMIQNGKKVVSAM